jgi:hypothetical protein
VRARGQATVDPVDYRAAVPVVTELIRCWGDLRFDDDGVVISRSNQRREGLRVLEGVHPNPGTRYRVVIVERIAPELTDEEKTELAKLRGSRAGSDQLIEWARRRRAELEASGSRSTQSGDARDRRPS